MITWPDIGHSFADRFDYASTFVAEDHREASLWIFARQCIGI
jgi:hypothetical protein